MKFYLNLVGNALELNIALSAEFLGAVSPLLFAAIRLRDSVTNSPELNIVSMGDRSYKLKKLAVIFGVVRS